MFGKNQIRHGCCFTLVKVVYVQSVPTKLSARVVSKLCGTI